MSKLHLEKIVLGMVQTNCYLIINEECQEGIIIDPADQAPMIIERVKKLCFKPIAILLTHGHFDHIGAAADLKRTYQIPIYAMEQEHVILQDAALNLSQMFGASFTAKADILLKDKQELTLGGFAIQVWHTPGHTKGGACYYLEEEKALFSGDTLFHESIGRTDFPTGSAATLQRSVQGLLAVLPEETVIYPGHEMMTDVAHEKMCNPYA